MEEGTGGCFVRSSNFFLQATACTDKSKSEAAKTALLLSVAGEDALDVFNNFVFTEEQSKEDYATVIAKFEEYCVEQQNEIHERYVFRSRRQGEAEPFEQFVRALKRQAQHCNFGAMTDDMVCDQVVFGTNSPKLREKMLRDKNLTLGKAVTLCKAAETSARQNEVWGKANEELHMSAVTARKSAQTGSRRDPNCTRCNRRHASRCCPAYGKTCYSCNGRNHFASCCRKQDDVYEVQHESDDFEVLDVAVGSANRERDWQVYACFEGQNVRFKVDTGSQANVLPLSMFRKLKAITLMPSGAVLRSYGGNVIKHIGKFSAPVTVDDHKVWAEFFVVKKDHSAILGLAGAKFFSHLDANAGFHQIPLDEQSSKMCTFATPFGRYRFLRLPFGLASASEVFQKALNEVFDGIPGVRVYVDDVLIWGATRAEHDQRLRSALKAAEAGLTFNASKCKFGVQEVLFLGDIISHKGIRPNPDLVDGLLKMPKPQDKSAVQRLLGVANYFGKYLPSLSQRTSTLRSLLKQDSIFDWTSNHENEWQAICQKLSEAPVLAIFDPCMQTKVTADASQSGVGSALLQRHGDCWKPVA
ncbi:hypothetical protein V5799_020780 [Amblyomma americanum]|uniref:RNA-directed DNA polymerase n=1 Tax=Amblyomma americanum TaxID=6943 RepID=A0AAQ4ETE7_AMBAM